MLPKQADIGIIVARLKANSALKRQAAERPHPMIMRPATKQHTAIELFNAITLHRIAAEKSKV